MHWVSSTVRNGSIRNGLHSGIINLIPSCSHTWDNTKLPPESPNHLQGTQGEAPTSHKHRGNNWAQSRVCDGVHRDLRVREETRIFFIILFTAQKYKLSQKAALDDFLRIFFTCKAGFLEGFQYVNERLFHPPIIWNLSLCLPRGEPTDFQKVNSLNATDNTHKHNHLISISCQFKKWSGMKYSRRGVWHQQDGQGDFPVGWSLSHSLERERWHLVLFLICSKHII